MFKRALVSVSDKTGLVEFLRPWVQKGLQVYSTGGTAQHLREAGIPVSDVSDLTQFPEVLNGRVKTLHPKIYMGLLADLENSSHLSTLQEYELAPFDLVVCNLYPFEQELMRTSELKALIEKIDIGGPTQLRAAAKNFKSVTVLIDPKDYHRFTDVTPNLSERQMLAAKVFRHISVYDQMISNALGSAVEDAQSFGGYLQQELRYGENPHQKASWYRQAGNIDGFHRAEILQGKELSYNNLIDLDAAYETLNICKESSLAGVIVKHTNPCSVAIAENEEDLIKKLLAADPVSMFGGIMALNCTITESLAQKMAEIFFECIVAPKVSDEAKLIFSKKKNLRILEWSGVTQVKAKARVRQIAGGFLVQEVDDLSHLEEWTKTSSLPPQVLKDLIFAERVAASIKSNSIAVVRDGMTLGLGSGQTNRVDATQQALLRAKNFHGDLGSAVLASDAFFPFADSIEAIAAAGIRWVLQPGGSIKDNEVIEAAKKYNIHMIMTGRRHFRH